MSKDTGMEKWAFVEIDSPFISELGEELDKYNYGDYPYLAMDVWKDKEHGVLWDLRFDENEPADYVPSDALTLHRVPDCQDYYSPRDQLLCYFVTAVANYTKMEEANE